MEQKSIRPYTHRRLYTVSQPGDDLMIQVQRVTVALDGVTRRDGPRDTAGPVGDVKRVHARLSNYRNTTRMSAPEAHALDSVLEQLRARLKFFGESV
jgi:hypothetical protein